MGRRLIERPKCADCGAILKKLGSIRCKRCACTINTKKREIRALAERFWEKVKIPKDPDNCWEWQGAVDPVTGYGRIGLGGRTDGVGNAHRVAYELTYEFIQDEMVICHSCNNPKCVNPLHLYEGTYSDNIKQAYRDGLRQLKKRAA